MRRSVRFWAFCALVVWPLRLFITTHFFYGLIIWYLVIQVAKRSGLFFAKVPTTKEWGVWDKYDEKKGPWTVLVTGASTGIGCAAARDLSRRGAKVVWMARSVEACKEAKLAEELACLPTHLYPGVALHLDLASLDAIKESILVYRRNVVRLNCIILNAGYHGPPLQTKDGFEMTMGVNHLGHMYLVYRLLRDLLDSGTPARIVVVASDLHHLSEPIRVDDMNYEQVKGEVSSWRTYVHSKLANVLFARELARRLKGTNVSVFIVHPGTPVPTELMRHSGIWGNWAVRKSLWIWWHLFCRIPWDGGQCLVHAAISPYLDQSKTGAYFENQKEMEVSRNGGDDAASAAFWDRSCQLLNIPIDWPSDPPPI